MARERSLKTKYASSTKAIQDARTIFLCQGFMEIVMPDTMKAKIAEFLKATE